MTSGWRGYYGGEIAYSNEGVTLSATGNGEGAVFDVLKPTKLEGAVLEMVVNVSDELFINGVSLQPFAQINGGTYHGEFNCWVHFSTLFPGMDQTITCTLDEVDKFDQTEYDVQMGVRAAGGTTYFSGTLLIKSATITLASVSASSSSSTANSSSSSSIVSSLSSSSVVDSSSSIVSSSSSAQAIVTPDFEADSPGATYGGAAWRMEDITATVVSLASVTGLPANGSSTNVLKVVIKEYNAAPIVFISIQDGKTLADYVVKVDAYFPRNTLGNSGSGSNYYKEFLFLADNTISSAAVDTEAAYQGKQNTIWSDVDVWKTFTFTPDATKAASLTGTIQIALGINRPPGDDVDAYFLDNIRLELKP